MSSSGPLIEYNDGTDDEGFHSPTVSPDHLDHTLHGSVHDRDHDHDGRNDTDPKADARATHSRWTDSIPIKPSLRLENAGSVARDHLASERTFLAYVRTSLAIASTGVALVQLFTLSTVSDTPIDPRVQKFARPLGATIVGLGLIVLALGTTRYFAIQKALLLGMFPAARLTLLLLAFALGSLVVVIFSALIAATT